LKFLLKKFKS